MRTMVCRIGLALLILMFSIFTVEAQVSPAAATGSGSIAGKVTDPSPVPGAPIPGAQVTATNESTGLEYSTKTDSDGSYSLSGLVAGNYRVRFASQGFKTEVRNPVLVEGSDVTHLDVRLTIGGGPHVEVTPAPASGQANAPEQASSPQRTGEIRGTVVDPQGRGIHGVKITVIEASTGRWYETVTDCGGAYRVANLASGKYSARFVKKEFRTETTTSFQLIPSQVMQLDGKLQIGAFGYTGPQVEPEVMAEIVPMEMELPSAIRGTVTDSTGAAVPARITVVDESTEKYRATTTDSDGAYQMPNLPAGRYCLGYEAGDWGSGTRSVVLAVQSQGIAEDIHLPARRETVEVCTDSCLIETEAANSAKPGIALHLYAESNVAIAGFPLWLTVTLTNTTEHTIVIRTDGGPRPVFAYQIHAYGRCACPGLLRGEGNAQDSSGQQLASQASPTSSVRVPPGGTLADRVDLSRLMDWSRAAAYGQTFSIWVSRFDTSKAKDGEERKDLPVVRSNWIKVALMAGR